MLLTKSKLTCRYVEFPYSHALSCSGSLLWNLDGVFTFQVIIPVFFFLTLITRFLNIIVHVFANKELLQVSFIMKCCEYCQHFLCLATSFFCSFLLFKEFAKQNFRCCWNLRDTCSNEIFKCCGKIPTRDIAWL